MEEWPAIGETVKYVMSNEQLVGVVRAFDAETSTYTIVVDGKTYRTQKDSLIPITVQEAVAVPPPVQEAVDMEEEDNEPFNPEIFTMLMKSGIFPQFALYGNDHAVFTVPDREKRVYCIARFDGTITLLALDIDDEIKENHDLVSYYTKAWFRALDDTDASPVQSPNRSRSRSRSPVLRRRTRTSHS